jgi:hypothetical protein
MKKSFLKHFDLSLSVISAVAPIAGYASTGSANETSVSLSHQIQQVNASNLLIEPAANNQVQYSYHSSHSSHSSHASHCSSNNACRTP